MSRQRFIHPSLWTSEQVMGLSMQERLLWIGIFSTADDHGKRKASALSLKVELFPGDAVDVAQIASWRDSIAASGLIRLYTDSNGVELLDIPSWAKYQKPKYVADSRYEDHPDIRSISGEDMGKTFPISGEDLPHIRPSGVEWCGVEKSGEERSGSEPTRTKAPASDAADIPSELKGLDLYEGNISLLKQWPKLQKAWTNTYPQLDIAKEVRKAHTWELANPSKQKRQKSRYLNGWMQRAQKFLDDNPRRHVAQAELPTFKPPTATELEEQERLRIETQRQLAEYRKSQMEGGQSA